jgi:hypothetical protein
MTTLMDDEQRFEEARGQLVGRLRRALHEAGKAHADLAAFEATSPHGLRRLPFRAAFGVVLETLRDHVDREQVH